MTPEVKLLKGTQVLCLQESESESIPEISLSHAPIYNEPRVLRESTNYRLVEELQRGDIILGIDNIPKKIINCKEYMCDIPCIIIKLDLLDDILVHPNSLILVKRRVQTLSKSGGWSSVPLSHFQRAKELRKMMTPPELKLWRLLRNKSLGVKFRPQHPIGPYIADFYARQAGLVIEVDGENIHNSPEQIKYDQIRDAWMDALGLKVLRYSAKDIVTNIDGTITDIRVHLKEYVLPNFQEAQWLFAQNIKANDTIYTGSKHEPCQVITTDIIHFKLDWYQFLLDDEGSVVTKTMIFHT